MSSPSSASPTSFSPSADSPSDQLLLNGKPIVILKNPNLIELSDSESSLSAEDSMEKSSNGSLIVGETSSETEDDSCPISETSYHSEDDDNNAFDLFKFSKLGLEADDSEVNYSSDAIDCTSTGSASSAEFALTDSHGSDAQPEASAESKSFNDCPK